MAYRSCVGVNEKKLLHDKDLRINSLSSMDVRRTVRHWAARVVPACTSALSPRAMKLRPTAPSCVDISSADISGAHFFSPIFYSGLTSSLSSTLSYRRHIGCILKKNWNAPPTQKTYSNWLDFSTSTSLEHSTQLHSFSFPLL